MQQREAEEDQEEELFTGVIAMGNPKWTTTIQKAESRREEAREQDKAGTAF